MRRHFFNFWCGLSLLACLTAGAMWIRSCFATDLWLVERPPPAGERLSPGEPADYLLVRFYSHGGGFRFVSLGAFVSGREGANRWTFKHEASPPGRMPRVWPAQVWWNHLGMSWLWTGNAGSRVVELILPYWLVMLSTAVAPGWKAARIFRWRKRIGQGRCAACGYDLRATPGRCPECGATPPPAAARATAGVA